MSSHLDDVYARLLQHYGPQPTEAAQSPFVRMVTAILAQNTTQKNVAAAIDNLRESGVLEPRAMFALSIDELVELIQPAGHAQPKAKRLHNVLKLIVKEYDGSIEALFANDRHSLREQLISVNGIGAETADSIVLFAAQLPSFVVDLATHRILARHGWIDFAADYEMLQDHFESSLERSVELYGEFHELLSRVGSEHCRKTPKCEGCPLQPLLKNGKPLEPYE
jgi:endonuclease-3 related protein